MSNIQTRTISNSSSKRSAQEMVQKFGRFLSGMVMPNIPSFIAWGLITSLFIPTGWMPNARLGELVVPIVHNLLPVLIGYTGGKMVGGVRGGVLGALATMGVITGGSKDVHQFLGAMIIGPFAGYSIKKLDKALEGKVPAGFEMLVSNFSAGILGGVLTVLGFLGVGPVVSAITAVLKGGVQVVMDAGLLPLSSLFIEPAKILFLNNAINFGILSPIGVAQVADTGKSIMFLLEANPGPGFGLLLAYWVFAKGMVKQSAPGAIIIQFLGGIHEIYFPYVLMKPILFLAVMAGGVSGVFTFSILGAGLISTPSPGSIFMLMTMSPRGGLLLVLAGVVVSTVVSFLVASFFIKRSDDFGDETELEDAKVKMHELKGKVLKKTNISKIIFACDAGMGSSAMGATTLKSRLKKAGLEIEVVHCPVDEVEENAEIVITHKSLTPRAKAKAPNAEHISITNFVNDPEYDALVNRLK
ncbi:MAG: PTS mannitol transporter subunit IICB [Clostridiaceae bacterium]